MNEDMNDIKFTRPEAFVYGPEGVRTGGAGGPGEAGVFAPPPKKKKTKFLIAGIAVGILVFAGIMAGLISHFVGGERYGGGEPYVGVLYIEGAITSSAASNDTYQQSWLLRQVEYMKNDTSNKGIMLYVNSPGGSVYPTDEMYLKLMEYKKETGRPLYAYFAETAASGAYYMSAAADKITANRNCTTGSVGVYVGPVIDASGLMEKVGLKVEIIKSAENKAMGNSYEPLTEEQRAIYQAYVDECYDQFVGIVAEGRGMTEAQVRTIADGRIYTASQALSNGLIDAVGTLADAKEAMKKDQELRCGFETVRYRPKRDLYSILTGYSKASAGQTDLQIAMELLNESSVPEVKYLMS